MGDVVLADALEEKGLFPDLEPNPDCYLVIAGPEERAAALGDAMALRDAGYTVAYGLKQVGFGKQFKLAGQSGARFALIYGEAEHRAGKVKFRDLTSGEETDIDRSGLMEKVSALDRSAQRDGGETTGRKHEYSRRP
jgi:histidyl-tRNA synthetase